MDFFKRYHEEISPALDPFLGGPPHCGPFRQIYETLKNAAAHGGDALIAVRRIQVLWIGGKGIGLEITVWDNGPGIGDVKAALLRGFTTRPDPLSDFYGQGKGLDMLYCREPFRYAADELMIESGNGKASRRSPFGPYRFERLQKFVPGTRVTIRFWPWRK